MKTSDDDLLQFTINENQLEANNNNSNNDMAFKKKRPPPTFQTAFSQARLPNHSTLVNYHEAFNTNSRSETLLEDTFIKPINPSTVHPTTSSSLVTFNKSSPITHSKSPQNLCSKQTSIQTPPDDFQDAAARFLASFVTSQSDSPPSSSEPCQHLSNPVDHLDHNPMHLITQSTLDPTISIETHPLLHPQNLNPTPTDDLVHDRTDDNEFNRGARSSSLGFSCASSNHESNQSRTPSPSLAVQSVTPSLSRLHTDPSLSDPHAVRSIHSKITSTLELAPPLASPMTLCLPGHPRCSKSDVSLLPSMTCTPKTCDPIPTKRPLVPHHTTSSTARPLVNKTNKKIKLGPQIFMNKTQRSSQCLIGSKACSSAGPVTGSSCTNVDQIQIWKKIQLLRSQRLSSLSKNSSIAEFHLDRLEKQWVETLRQAGTLSSGLELKNQVENYQEMIKQIQDLLGEELVRVQIEESILRHVRGIIADRLIQIEEWNSN